MQVFDCAGLVLIGMAVFAAGVPASAQPARPSITSVSHLAVYAADPAKTEAFYVHDLGAVKRPDLEDPAGTRYYFSPVQFIEVLPLPAGSGVSRLDHAAFNVSDAEGMRRYLISKGTLVPRKLSDGSDGSRWFRVKDPEGATVEFVQPRVSPPGIADGGLSTHIIHVGFTIHDRKLEDTFYRDVLGFRPYWAGGMKDDVTSWVSQQVPDGPDWLEYMIVTSSLTQAQTGVLNHFSLGVPNMEAAYTTLWNGDRLQGQTPATVPKIGRDAKWQLNLIDPDGTRAEVMEFHAIGKPCCSAFTASDPEK